MDSFINLEFTKVRTGPTHKDCSFLLNFFSHNQAKLAKPMMKYLDDTDPIIEKFNHYRKDADSAEAAHNDLIKIADILEHVSQIH